MFKIAITALSILLSSALYAKSDYHIGQIDGTQIIQDFPKFEKHKDDVEFSTSQIAGLAAYDKNVTIKVFFGQWCHDSQREVPRLIKLFKQVNNRHFDVQYYGLDIEKSDPDGQAVRYDIKRTPTIIVLKDDNEISRFLEFPITDWATDIYQALTQ